MDGLIYVYALPKGGPGGERDARRPQSRRTPSRASGTSASGRDSLSLTPVTSNQDHQQTNARTGMTAVLHKARGSISTSSSSSRESQELLTNPFELRHGRRYLRDMAYPLPCDLAEIQRQNMRTLLAVTVFDKALCSPSVTEKVPRKVLELGCGSAYWSATCHQYFSTLGYPDVSFTGLDIAPLAPDLKRQGVNWTFVQHDLRRMPWPFDDECFDLVMVKDLSFVVPIGAPTQRFMDECIRILTEGGVLEVWESDDIIRCLMPYQPPLPRQKPDEEETAYATQTFPVTPGMPFALAQNKYIQDSNAWIEEALDRRRLPASPCTAVTQALHQEPDSLCNVGYRRIAVPLAELWWEKERPLRKESRAGLIGGALTSKGKARMDMSSLTTEQAALRDMALLTVIQKIESLEPALKEVSGKNYEEWANWWANMMTSLMEQGGASGGECLELGAWWATKRTV